MVFLANFGNLKAMEFRTAANGGNCVGCNWLVAEGEIKQDTHIKFNEFVKENGGVPFTVILNSNGGNLYSAIQLGIRFRELGLITRIARSIPATWCKRDSDEICPDYYEEMRKGKCLSACAYAFLGGRERDVASKNKVTGHPDSIIGFHQFYNDKPKNEKIKKIKSEFN